MQLPISNKNAELWRDDKRAIDNVDFDPAMIDYDRERKSNFFLNRYEKPKELAEWMKYILLTYSSSFYLKKIISSKIIKSKERIKVSNEKRFFNM